MYFLQNEYIGLRNLKEEDVNGGYANWFNDDEVCEFNSHHKFPMTETMLINFVKNANSDRSAIVMAVDEKESDHHIGNISLQKIDMVNRQAEIAFMFGEKRFWNKGYATMAAELMINHAFSELGLNRIYFGTAENNIGMQKIGEKLNFQRCGILRQALYKHGKYLSLYSYELLKEEWTKRD